MNRILMQLILDLAMFLDSSGEDTIREDAAVDQLEYIAGTLQDLTPEERDEFVRYIGDRALEARSNGERQEFVEFLESFPESAGLIEEVSE